MSFAAIDLSYFSMINNLLAMMGKLFGARYGTYVEGKLRRVRFFCSTIFSPSLSNAFSTAISTHMLCGSGLLYQYAD